MLLRQQRPIQPYTASAIPCYPANHLARQTLRPIDTAQQHSAHIPKPPVKIPRFPECHHPFVNELMGHTDPELLRLFQQQPQSGRYFMALFCRYGPLVYSVIHHSTQSSAQVDYRFAQIWKQIYDDLPSLDLDQPPFTATSGNEDNAAADHGRLSTPRTLQNWIIDAAASCIRDRECLDADDIRYSLTYAPPPLWCYLERSLDQLSPLHRLVVVLHRTFGWPVEEITTYLTSNGTDIDHGAVVTLLEEGFYQIDAKLPDDLQSIYLYPNTASKQG